MAALTLYNILLTGTAASGRRVAYAGGAPAEPPEGCGAPPAACPAGHPTGNRPRASHPHTPEGQLPHQWKQNQGRI